MTPQEQIIALAEALGWKYWEFTRSDGTKFIEFIDWEPRPSLGAKCIPGPANPEDYDFTDIPPFSASLDALHEAKRKLLVTWDLCAKFEDKLFHERLTLDNQFPTDGWPACQPANVQLRALLKTLGIWKS